MKQSTVWKHGEPISTSTCDGSTDAGSIATGGMWAVICRRTYALSRIRLQCVRGLLSQNDSDPLQEIRQSVCVWVNALNRQSTDLKHDPKGIPADDRLVPDAKGSRSSDGTGCPSVTVTSTPFCSARSIAPTSGAQKCRDLL